MQCLNKLNLFVTACLILGLLMTYPASAQTSSLESQSKPTSSKKLEKLERAWDPVNDSFFIDGNLPANYLGSSARGLIKWIEGKGLQKKGEYEKQADYEMRLEAGSAPLKMVRYAFSIDEFKYENYDADKEAFLAYGEKGRIYVLDVNKFITEKHRVNIKSYPGRSLLGVNVIIKHFEGENYGIQVLKRDFEKFSLFSIKRELYTSSVYFSHDLKVPIEQAKTILASDIKTLLIGYVNPGEINSRTMCFTPTVDLPYLGCTTEKFVSFRPNRIYIYDSKSGQILYDESL